VTVPESLVKETILRLLHEDHIVAEGAGATAVAALPLVSGRRKLAVVSGGNIDANVLFQLHQEGYRCAK
jgi:threonine dehydratase